MFCWKSMIKKKWSFTFHSFSRRLLLALEDAQTSTCSPPSNSSPSTDLMILWSVLDLKTTKDELFSLGLPQPGAGGGKSSNFFGGMNRVWRHRIPSVVVFDEFSIAFINFVPFPFWSFTEKIRYVSFHSESFHSTNKLRPRISLIFRPSSVTSNLERSAEPRWPLISTVHSTSAMVGVYKSLVYNGLEKGMHVPMCMLKVNLDWLHTRWYKNTRSIKWYLNLGNEKFRYQWFRKCSRGKKVLGVFFPYLVSLGVSFSHPLQPTHHARYFISADGWWPWPSGPWVRMWQVLLEQPAVFHEHPSKRTCSHFQWMGSAGYSGTLPNKILVLPTGKT